MKTKALVLIGILIIAFAAMVAPVMAAESGTTTITGNPAKTMAVTVTGGISNWVLDPTTSPKVDSSSVTLSVSSNSPGWVVSVKDGMEGSKTAGSEGKMAEYITGTSSYSTLVLGTAMEVISASHAGFTGQDVATLSGTDQAIESGASDYTAANTFSNTALTFKQPVAITDSVLPSGHVYRIMITFTGTTP